MSEPIKILIVEDSIRKYEQIREICDQVLGRSQVALVHATSVSAAMTRLSEASYEAMILDLHLPMRDDEVARKEGGLDLLRELRRVGDAEFHVPSLIIGLTQYEDLKAEHTDVFSREGGSLLLYSDSVTEWRGVLTEKLQLLSRTPSPPTFVRVSETSRFDEAFRDRLAWLVTTIRSLGEDQAATPSVQYLRHLDSKGSLRRLVYEATSEPRVLSGDSGSFYFSLDDGMICFSAKFKTAWLAMVDELQLPVEGLCDSIDNFILHELFHVGQHLTTERHGDIRYAQSVLRVLDYHADANAAMAAMKLYEKDAGATSQEWRTRYSRVLSSVLRQIYVFDYAAKPEKLPPSRLIRHLTWHYHFHRLSRYIGSRPFVNQPLFIEPAFSLRGSSVAGNDGGFPRNWPSCEPAEVARDKPHLWMAVPNQFGIPTVYRFLSTKPQHYQALFDGIFACDAASTAPFFGELFNQYGQLIND